MTKDKAQDTKALAIIDTSIFNLQTIAEGSTELSDNLDQIDIRLPNIKIKHAGAEIFEMPDGSKIQSFEGIILDFHKVNSYWKDSFTKTGGGVPPDCFSLDAIKPSALSAEVQSLTCVECPHNQFGSGVDDKGQPTSGKACKNLKVVHIITQSNQLLPFRMLLPPSNQKAFDTYISGLVARGLPWRMVWTRFGLHPQKNKGGITYSELDLTALSELPKEQAAMSKEIALRMRPILRSQEIVREEEV